MLTEVSLKEYRQKFPVSPHPFISESFIELVKDKADRVVRLMENERKVSMGLVAGIKDGILISPFSAPFGGFHFSHNNIFTSDIDRFITKLISYAISQKLVKIELALPPDIYHHSFNSKIVNSLLRNGFSQNIPEITNWVDLHKFGTEFCNRNARFNYNQSLRHNLTFHEVSGLAEKEVCYNIVYENRKRLGHKISMTFNDLIETGKLWPIDFFQVRDTNAEIVAASIFYRGHPNIIQGIFWGDSEQGRLLRAMDFCSFNLWRHYKSLNLDFIDLGISTEFGIPADGLIRFKEDHDCVSAIRESFTYNLVHI